MNFNKTILLGNLTRDVAVTYTANGLAIGKFGMAINRWRKDKEDAVCFVDLTAFGGTAEAIERNLGKGDPIFIEGRLDFSQWEDKQTGAKRSKLSVVVESFQFVGGGRRNEKQPTREAVDHDNTIPF